MAEAHTNHHDYHLVDPSPWPAVGATSAFLMAFGGICLDASYVRRGAAGVRRSASIGILYTFIGWWRDVIREAQYEGFHTRVVQISHRYGMILFIASEVMFFVAWFWAYFNTALFPGDVHDYGRMAFTHGVWPPQGIETFNPWHLPLLNTLILLTSGTTVTWAHHALLGERPAGAEMGPGADHPARPHLHLRAGLRIRARGVPLQRQHLRRHLLHGDRLPRRPCDHRLDLPDRLPVRAPSTASSAQRSISASSSPPGTGISSTWCGCSCSPAYMCGAPAWCIPSDRRAMMSRRGGVHGAALLL